jgi:GH15 family glucan-1,4-alpha-glucosidase
MYPYGLVGNCQISALVSQFGAVDWLCLPRPDSPPVFGALLDKDGGSFQIDPCGTVKRADQKYIDNTNVLQTRIILDDGSEYLITDFCPRFMLYGRMHRPNALFRIIERKAGNPCVTVNFQPVTGWDKIAPQLIQGNSHISFPIRGSELRLTTNMPLTYLLERCPFTLQEPIYLVLTWGAPFEDDLVSVSKDFLEKTIRYWQTWVQYCSIPSQFQKQTIRSALSLKLHCHEDTGAILAALTTSLPEELGGHRNWDYRYCWLRDAYFVLSAFYHLGQFEEMEGYLKFLLNVAHSESKISPVYKLDHRRPLPETEHTNWSGYQNHAPVRSHNQAAEHIQNDVYGEMILTLAPIYLDERFRHLRSRDHEDLLRSLAILCKESIDCPDAGLWEVRNHWQPHSFTNLMCWAGLDRLQKIQETGHIAQHSFDLAAERDKAFQAVLSATKNQIVRNSAKDESLDAALLMMPLLRFPNLEVCTATVNAIDKQLQYPSGSGLADGFLYRYLRKDDFGRPQSAFLACSFWLAQALAKLGETTRATTVLSNTLRATNHLGLISEHYDPIRGMQLGNFPQGYSHVGQINAAFAVSPPWTEVL